MTLSRRGPVRMTRVRSYRRGSIATIYFLVENRSGSRGFSKRNANVSIRDTVVGGIITERWLPICDVTGTPPSVIVQDL